MSEVRTVWVDPEQAGYRPLPQPRAWLTPDGETYVFPPGEPEKVQVVLAPLVGGGMSEEQPTWSEWRRLYNVLAERILTKSWPVTSRKGRYE